MSGPGVLLGAGEAADIAENLLQERKVLTGGGGGAFLQGDLAPGRGVQLLHLPQGAAGIEMERQNLAVHHLGRVEGHLLGALADVIPEVGIEGGNGRGRTQQIGDIGLSADTLMDLRHPLGLDIVAVNGHDGSAGRRDRNQQADGEQFDSGRSGHDNRHSVVAGGDGTIAPLGLNCQRTRRGDRVEHRTEKAP